MPVMCNYSISGHYSLMTTAVTFLQKKTTTLKLNVLQTTLNTQKNRPFSGTCRVLRQNLCACVCVCTVQSIQTRGQAPHGPEQLLKTNVGLLRLNCIEHQVIDQHMVLLHRGLTTLSISHLVIASKITKVLNINK